MRGRILFGPVLIIAVGCTLLLSACGGSGGSVVNSVSITPTSANVALGGQLEFSATVNVTNSTTSTSTAVTWEVNGIVSGNATVGTITPSPTDNETGVYTAPVVVPSTDNGQVNITAVATQTSTTTSASTNTVTSNTAVVTIGTGLVGFTIAPAVSSVPAGGTIQFSASLNGVADPNATWSVSATNGGDSGTIGAQSGLYTAPLSPPPGAAITVTGQDGTNSATETMTVVYSDHSLTGPYAFTYTGNDQLGFFGAAGSFQSDGNGHIESGVEDTQSFLTGVSTEVPISGTYTVGSDGRATAMLSNGTTWRFVLTTNQHALLLRFDTSHTGSGTIDQQDLSALTSSNSIISGPYVFSASGSAPSTTFSPLGIAGRFVSNGSGQIPSGNNALDVNNGGSVTANDQTLAGSYQFDSTFPGTGRGSLTLTSTATGQRQYAFYAVDSTHLNFIEIDQNAFLAGMAFSAPAANSFSDASLASGNYAFTYGGNSSAGAYSAGGVFASDGGGHAASGVFDSNNAGTVALNGTMTSCAYTVDSATGRIDLTLCPSSATHEFAMYQTSQGPAFMLELDSTAVSTGIAYPQQASAVGPEGRFALELAGQGTFHNAPASYPQDAEGQLNLGGTGGTLDINDFGVRPFPNAVVTISSLGSPTSGNGRGTIVLTATNPLVTYNLVYYLIDDNTALLFDQDSGFILTGILSRQF
ncbi:MAG: hypothetical protein ACRD4C_12360 [Candidatus Acidiferrales bacterium]